MNKGLPKDIIRLLIQVYFDQETLYQCQFVSMQWYQFITPERLDLVRRIHSSISWVDKQREKNKRLKAQVARQSLYNDFIIKNLSKPTKTSQKNKERQLIEERMEFIPMCLFCCTPYLPNVKESHFLCRDRPIVCLNCPLNDLVLHKFNNCPIKLVQCGNNAYKKPASFGFLCMSLVCEKLGFVSSCDFKGCAREEKYHWQHRCKRQCLKCNEWISVFPDGLLYHHVRKCYPVIKQLRRNDYSMVFGTDFHAFKQDIEKGIVE